MSIKDIIEKSKASEWELFIASLIILSAFLIFGLVYLAQIESNKQPVQIENAIEKTPQVDNST